MREREKTQLLKSKKKKKNNNTYYANAIKLHDPLPIPSQLQLQSLPVFPRAALLPTTCLRATRLGVDSQGSLEKRGKIESRGKAEGALGAGM